MRESRECSLSPSWTALEYHSAMACTVTIFRLKELQSGKWIRQDELDQNKSFG
jgi:hypothetical protein